LIRDAGLVPIELRDRLPALSARPWVLNRIAEWCLTADRFFILSGGPGTGKTMISALKLGNDRSGLWVASYFCSNRLAGFSHHPRQFVTRLQRSLLGQYPQAYLPHESRPLISMKADISAKSMSGTATGINVAIGNLTASPNSLDDYFQTMIIEPLHEIAVTDPNRRLGILIDGLDEAVAHEGIGIHDLVIKYASSFPENCKILITTQNNPAIVDPLLAAAQDIVHLDLSEQRHRATVIEDVRNYVRHALTEATGTVLVRARQLADDIAASAQGNFLQAGSLVRELLRGTSADLRMVGHQSLDRYYLTLFDRSKQTVDGNPDTGISWADDCLPLMHCLAVAQTVLSYRELVGLLGKEETQVSMVLRVIRAFLQVGSHYESISLEHKSVAEFLLSPVLSDGNPNQHAMREVEVHRGIVERTLCRLAEDWGGQWGNADNYAAMYLAAHLNRLQTLTGERIAYGWHRLRPADLARRIGTDLTLSGDYYEAMSQILTASRRWWPDREFEDVAAASARSRDPYVRTAVVDALVESADADLTCAQRIVRALLDGHDLHAWTTALYAIVRFEPRLRHEMVRWIACHASEELRKCASYMLYLLAGGNRKLIAADMLMAVARAISLVRIKRTRRVLDFLSNVSITAYVNNCDDLDVAEATSDLWKYVAINRLHLNIVNRPILEKPIISVVARRLANRIVDNDALRGQLGAVPEAYQDLAEQLLPALTPGHDLSDLLQPLREGFAAKVWAPRILSGCVLAIQAITNLDDCASQLDQLFEESSGDARVWQVAAFAVLMKSTPNALRERVATMVGRVLAENRPSLARYVVGDGANVDLFAVSLPLAHAKQGAPLIDFAVSAVADGDQMVRRSALEGLAVVGLYYPDTVLAALAQLRDSFRHADAGLLRILSRIYPMHPTMVDVFLREMDPAVKLDGVEAAEMEFARKYVDALGLYNNAVHQAIYYPMMRRDVLAAGFADMLHARTPNDFVTRYAPRILRLIRESEYEVIRWTR
jgi:hypothetical protein